MSEPSRTKTLSAMSWTTQENPEVDHYHSLSCMIRFLYQLKIIEHYIKPEYKDSFCRRFASPHYN